MARHGTGNVIAGKPPFTYTGAGANSIKEKVGVGEVTAKGIFDRLQQYGLIRPAPKEVKATYPFQARYELIQEELDLDLPYCFIDELGKTVDSAIKRSRKAIKILNYDKELSNISRDELRLDALISYLKCMPKQAWLNMVVLVPYFSIENGRRKLYGTEMAMRCGMQHQHLILVLRP